MRKRKEPNPNDLFPKVAANFSAYEAFRSEKKRTLENPIQLAEKKSAQRVFIGRVSIADGRDDTTRRMEAEICEYDTVKYSLKVWVSDFGDQPCLRFDSRGNPHMNPEDGEGLTSRPVPCPHFHRIMEDGWMRAYHTQELADPVKAAEIALDVSAGRDLACKEFSIGADDGNALVLFKKAATMTFKPSSGALDGAHFP